MIRKTYFAFLLPFLWNVGLAQTYTGTGGIIFDDGRINDYTLDIPDLSPESLTPEHGLLNVCINVAHSWVADLDIRLISPSGVNVMLTSALGGDTDFYENTCFTADAGTHILRGSSPYTGDFLPFSPIGNANDGQSGRGNWVLKILDTYPYADGGDVLSWSLTFGEGVEAPVPHAATALPIIIISTDNQMTIPNEPKIPGSIRVIHNHLGGLNHFNDPALFESNLGIEVRGSSSQSFPKKSFGFETQDEEGKDLETELLGLPKEEDWILYAPYTDKSFLRDAITFKLGNDLGNYTPRSVFCELYINGDYHGVYCLEEKIKRDKNRVDIKKLNPTDITGDALTGGYLLKVDRDDGEGTYFVSNYEGTFEDKEVRVVFEDPEGEDLQPVQKEYIQEFYNAFEDALFGPNFTDPLLGYRRYADVSSLIDFFIISELGHNVDAYRLSTFFYKDRNSVDSLFHFGPLWDFNLAYGNVDYCESQYVEGWAYEHSGSCDNTPLWWARLLQDPYYQDRLKCRFDSLRQTVLSSVAINDYIETQALELGDAAMRNYDRWPILSMYIWPNFFIGSTYQEEIDYLKLWIVERLNWMEAHIPGECLPVSNVIDGKEVTLVLSPNPASKTFTIRTTDPISEKGNVSIRNPNGVSFYEIQSYKSGEEIEISSLAAGLYFVTLTFADGRVYQQKLVVID